MYQADTNIFLAILLKEERAEICQRFLMENSDKISLSDFSLHSIGNILFHKKKADVFTKFTQDILRFMPILTLTRDQYPYLEDIKRLYNFDFDDAYQYQVAKSRYKILVTMDSHFNECEGINVKFLE